MISAKFVEYAKVQYRTFIINNKFTEKMEQFNIRKDKVDEFYVAIFSDILSFPKLKEVVKLCIILFHGSARVEYGFSINELLLDVNMEVQSLVAQ